MNQACPGSWHKSLSDDIICLGMNACFDRFYPGVQYYCLNWGSYKEKEKFRALFLIKAVGMFMTSLET